MTNTVGRVAGKVAFITGAARGQGREHAIRLAEEGADIIAVDVCRDIDGAGYPGATEADLDETAALVEKLDRRIVTAKADVRDLDGLRAALQQGVDKLGRPDVVIRQCRHRRHPVHRRADRRERVADDARHQSDRCHAHDQGGTAAHD